MSHLRRAFRANGYPESLITKGLRQQKASHPAQEDTTGEVAQVETTGEEAQEEI